MYISVMHTYICVYVKLVSFGLSRGLQWLKSFMFLIMFILSILVNKNIIILAMIEKMVKKSQELGW